MFFGRSRIVEDWDMLGYTTGCVCAHASRQTPESDIPPSYRATRRHTKMHLGFCLRFSTLIGHIGRVPPFGAGPRRYIRSRLFRLAVTAFWRALTAFSRQKGKRILRSGPYARTLQGKRQKAIYCLVTAPQGGIQKYTLAFAYDSPR